eukprot:gene12941-biopygen4994
MVTPEDGLSSRRTVAAGRRNNEYDEDMCEFLRIRFTPEDVPDEEGFLMRHDVNRISFDLRHASLSVSETALDASDGVVCSVTRTVRVLQTLPCVAMQTLDVTRAVSDKALFIDHFVRAPMSYGNGAAVWTFDGSLYNTSAAQHFVLSAASSDCVSGGGMLAASYMGLGEVTCEGFNVIPGEGAGSEARVRLRVPPETESFTLHILCCCSEGKKARESMLALLRAGTSASSLFLRHDMAWEALWQSRVDIVSKAAGMLQEETSAFMRDLFTLRMAMYQLHASCGGFMDLSGTSASGASCVHVAIASSLLLPTYRGQVVPLSRLHEDGVPELGLSGLYLDMVPWSDIGRWSDPATGAPRFLLPMSDGLRPFAGCMHAVSLWDTYRLSGDAGWLARVAFPVLSNVADMSMASEREEHPSEFDGHTSRLRRQRRSENQAREEDIDPRAALELMKALQQQKDKQHEEERARLQQKLEAMLTAQQQNDKQQEERARRQQELEARLKAEKQINDKQQEERARRQQELEAKLKAEQQINAQQQQELEARLKEEQQIYTQLQKQLQTALQQAPGYVSDNNEVFKVKSARDAGDEAWHTANIERINNTMVINYDKEVRIRDMINISVELIYYTVVDSDKSRICITIGPEQCQKSAYIAFHVIVASMIGRPSIKFIKDVKVSVETTCNEKIGNSLKPFGIEALFVNDKKKLLNMAATDIEKFKAGKISIVAQTNHLMVKNVHEFVRKNKVFDIAMTLDEADAVFSSSIDKGNIMESTDNSKREQEVLRLFDINEVDYVPFRNGRIRCSAFVSATHMSTINLIHQTGFTMSLHAMDLAAVKGYAVRDAVVPFKNAEGQPVWIPGPANNKNQYHLKSDETDMFMKEFVKDCAILGRKGGFLMAVMSPYIISNHATNANNVVKHLLDKYAEHSKNEVRSPSKYVIGIVVSGTGIKVYEMGLETNVIKELPQGEAIVKPILSTVIKWIDEKYGIDTPLIASGAKCLTRGVSMRSEKRVLIHMIVTPTEGTNVCDVHQTVMRCGGHTIDVRKENGFEYKIKTLLQESDHHIIVYLFDLVVQWLKSKIVPGAQEEWLKNRETNVILMKMIERRPLASRGSGKQLAHDIEQQSSQAKRGSVPNETYPAKLARQDANKKARDNKLDERIEQERADRASYEENKDKALSTIDPERRILCRIRNQTCHLMVEDELKTNNPDFKFELAGKNQESKFLMSYKGNTRLAGKTLNDWNNCYTAYILRPVQCNLASATGSVTPTATWEFVIKDGRVMAKYSTTHVEPPLIASPRETPEGGGTQPTTFNVWMDMIRKYDGHKELQRYFKSGSNGNLYQSCIEYCIKIIRRNQIM